METKLKQTNILIHNYTNVIVIEP